MPSFIVRVQEVHIQEVRVEAVSKETAIQAVVDGAGEYLDNALEYSHCLDTERWSAEEE